MLLFFKLKEVVFVREFKLCAFADEADVSLQGQIKALKENNISLLEIRNVDNVNVSDLSVSKAREIKSLLDDSNIKVWSIGSPIGKVDLFGDMQEHFEKFKRTIELANLLEAKAFRLFSFYLPEDKNPDDFSDEVCERLSKFADFAKGSGVVLCHENEKGIFGDIAKRCKIIHENVKDIKAVFDPANFIQCNQDTLAAFEMLKDYIYYFHIKDAINEKVVPAGFGQGQIAELLKQYKGDVLTLEPHLYDFSGLDSLEREGEKTQILSSFNSQRDAFDFGVKSLRDLIEKENLQ